VAGSCSFATGRLCQLAESPDTYAGATQLTFIRRRVLHSRADGLLCSGASVLDNPADALRMLSANLLGKVIETPVSNHVNLPP
jgi:hypothetical protein